MPAVLEPGPRTQRAPGRNGDRKTASSASLAPILLALGLTLVGPGPLVADPFPALRANPFQASASRAARQDAAQSIPVDKLDAGARAKVAYVLADASFFRRMPVCVIPCDPELYLFLVEHPDVIVNVWQVLGVTQVAMQQADSGGFWVTDPAGTKGTVEYLYSDHDTQVIYTEGAYDGPLFARPVRGRGLLILKSGYVREPDGRHYVTTRMDAFMRVENVGAELLTKAFSPLVGKVADINFTYTAGFVGHLSQTAEKNHESVQRLAGKLDKVRPEVRGQFAKLAERVAEKATDLAQHDFNHPPLVVARPTDEDVQ
jgi:hypothetical protein